jgi:hypothetical protein
MSKGSISKKEIPTPEKGIRKKEKEEEMPCVGRCLVSG